MGTSAYVPVIKIRESQLAISKKKRDNLIRSPAIAIDVPYASNISCCKKQVTPRQLINATEPEEYCNRLCPLKEIDSPLIQRCPW
jgi:hypothetical protein